MNTRLKIICISIIAVIVISCDLFSPQVPIPSDEPSPTPVVGMTKEPTAAPTRESTEAPPDTQTPASTLEPSGAPTEGPPPIITSAPAGVPTHVITSAPTEEPTLAPTEDPTPVPTGEPAPLITPAPTEEPTPNITSVPPGEPSPGITQVPTGVPTTAPTMPPVSTPVHYATIYFVEDTDCTLEQYSEGYTEVQNALQEIEKQYAPVEFTIVTLGRTWDGPTTSDSSEALIDIYYDFRSYGGENRYVIGCIPDMGINNGVGYFNGNYCVISFGGLIDLNLAVVTAHELTHNFGMNAGGHVDSYIPSAYVCIMNYIHAALMDPQNMVWCSDCRSTVQNKINQLPVRY